MIITQRSRCERDLIYTLVLPYIKKIARTGLLDGAQRGTWHVRWESTLRMSLIPATKGGWHYPVESRGGLSKQQSLVTHKQVVLSDKEKLSNKVFNKYRIRETAISDLQFLLNYDLYFASRRSRQVTRGARKAATRHCRCVQWLFPCHVPLSTLCSLRLKRVFSQREGGPPSVN